MRIPPSVIVMSLLTAAPFGLAIRDTLARNGAVSATVSDDGTCHGLAAYVPERVAAWPSAVIPT